MTRTRGFYFTINNYTDDDMADFMILAHESTYAICGFEEAPTTGTPHMQCYIHFENARTYDSILKKIRARNLHTADGTAKHNQTYCSKTGDYWEYGILPENGVTKKSSIGKLVVTRINNGATYADIMREFPEYMLTQSDKVKYYINQTAPKKDTKFYVMWKHNDEFIKHLPQLINPVIVTELSRLELYDSYSTVILDTTHFGSMFTGEADAKYWPIGNPISYKNGYQYKRVICDMLIILVKNPDDYKNYPGYKIISSIHDIWHSESVLDLEEETIKEEVIRKGKQ